MKTLIAIVIAAMIGLSSYAATVSVVVAASGVSNIVSGSLSASQFVLTSAANNVGTIKLIDSPSTILTNVNPAYIASGVYATNYITSYTNYFGVQNLFTNIASVTYSITNAATTNYYPTILALNAATNQSVIVSGVSYDFNRGITVTNAGSGSVTFSVTYTQ